MATATVTVPVDSEQFLRLYDQDDEFLRKYELFDGEVTECPMTNRIHDGIKNLGCSALSLYLHQHPGHLALVETTFKLGARMVFTPDLALISGVRWNAMADTFASGSPDIAFEVISSDSADRLKFKTDSYLDFGSKAVCCIYPNQRRIMLFSPVSIRELRGNDSLEFPDSLPGFSMPLTAIFGSERS